MRRHLTYANVVASLALFVALGGTTVAATKIHGKAIRAGTVPGKALKAKTITGAKLRPDTLTGVQIDEGRLGRVPSAVRADSAGAADHAARATRADSAATATRAGDAATVGGRSAAQLRDACPAATVRYGVGCFETAARPSATWSNAAKTCADAGRRLPDLDELEAYRRRPGVTIGSPEHTAGYVDHNGVASGGEFTVGLYDNGAITVGLDYDTSAAAYRCIAPLTESD